MGRKSVTVKVGIAGLLVLLVPWIVPPPSQASTCTMETHLESLAQPAQTVIMKSDSTVLACPTGDSSCITYYSLQIVTCGHNDTEDAVVCIQVQLHEKVREELLQEDIAILPEAPKTENSSQGIRCSSQVPHSCSSLPSS